MTNDYWSIYIVHCYIIQTLVWFFFQFRQTSLTLQRARTWWCARVALWPWGARPLALLRPTSRGDARVVSPSLLPTARKVGGRNNLYTYWIHAMVFVINKLNITNLFYCIVFICNILITFLFSLVLNSGSHF